MRSSTTARAFSLRRGSAAPLGLNKCVPIINPELAPWAMQECRPKGLFYDNTQINVSARTRLSEYIVLVAI